MNTVTKHLFENAGFYMPAFFDMFIDTDKSLDSLNLQSLNEDERSVFFHEYIHFMQDFMTDCGFSNIYSINERFRLIASDYATQNPFYVPVDIKNNRGNVKLNVDINNLVWGGEKIFDDFQIYSWSSKELKAQEMSDVGLSPFQYVTLNTNRGQLDFGKREIMESMAYILQRICTKTNYSSPEYPYCAVEKLAKFICHTGFEDDLFNLVALCDVAIMSSNPGFAFVTYLQRISLGNLIVNKPEDIYDDFYSRKGFCNGKEMAPMEHFQMLSNWARQALKSYIDIPQINDQLYPWIDLMFDTGVQARLDDRYFFLNLARSGYLMQNDYFLKILNKVGSPLIHNNKNEYGRFKSNPDYGDIFQYLLALMAIENIFMGRFECQLIVFCNQSKGHTNINVNNNCINAPWKRCSDKDLCPVAMIIKHRKLALNEPVLRINNNNHKN